MLLYCNITKDTGMKLAKALNIPGINPYKMDVPSGKQKVIRWGCGAGINYIPSKVFNKMKAVRLATNKCEAANKFIDAGVNTAQFTNKVPCVGRSFQHTQGQNFWLCWEDSQILTAIQEGAQYFVKYIPIKQEYRVHILGGKFAFAQKKYKTDRVSSSFMGIQGFSNNWHKNICEESLSTKIINSCIKAVKCLGLDFGGVDVLISLEDNEPYVAEVNTGPALPSDKVLDIYVKYFKENGF